MFDTVPLDQIIVNRDDRQRKKLENLEELKESLSRIGLINPIVVTRDNVLIAGERRYTSAKELGWDFIHVHYKEDLDQDALDAIELEENLKRDALPWQDACDAVRKLHERKTSADPSWTQEQTAQVLGLKQHTISQYLTVANALAQGIDRVVAAPKFSTALNVAKRVEERKRADTTAAIKNIMVAGPALPDEPKVTTLRAVPLLNEDFNEWALAYTGRRFNLVHCDFPYGVNADNHAQGAAGEFGGYEDSPDVYWELLDTLAGAMDNVVAESAHLIFWFSMDFYQETLERLEAMGWKVNPFPLIWFKTDNTGILPDPNRGPRRVYETAFFASRGDRKLTANGAVGNVSPFAGRNKEIHMSEKPVPMLKHFLRMVVDEYTIMLDPTAGSANALKAATQLGAPSVLGLEKSEEFFARSTEAYYTNEGDL